MFAPSTRSGRSLASVGSEPVPKLATLAQHDPALLDSARAAVIDSANQTGSMLNELARQNQNDHLGHEEPILA
jgi:hypothetical protein